MQSAESNAYARMAELREDRLLTRVGMGDLRRHRDFMHQRRAAGSPGVIAVLE
ncbi:MAG: hypothetical protein ACJA2W_002634 [Planctomycetota bacterium]|jgi:hypothetical protein